MPTGHKKTMKVMMCSTWCIVSRGTQDWFIPEDKCLGFISWSQGCLSDFSTIKNMRIIKLSSLIIDLLCILEGDILSLWNCSDSFFLILFIYFERQREHEQGQRQREERERIPNTLLSDSMEPNIGLNAGLDPMNLWHGELGRNQRSA